MAVAGMIMGCRTPQEEELGQEVKIPLSVCLPMSDTYAPSEGGPRRVMGDPGMQERFELPNYIYFFIVKNYAAEGENWKVWDQVVIDDANTHWQKEYYSGTLVGSGDSIYRYSREVVKQLAPGDKFNGRVYAIVSAEELTFNTTLTNSESTLNDLLNLKFSTSGTMQRNLQNVYSTPYNYNVGGKYYGSFSSIDHNVPVVNLMLYHVAAKVDITWSVADEVRIKADSEEAVRLTRMDACNLFNHDAYCFKPMENSSGASPLSPDPGDGDTIKIVDAGDEGLWWEGRSYFYTIPYTTTGKTGYFPLQMSMETNGSKAYYRPTIYLQVDTSSPFVPWLRATFKINAPLTARTDEKIVNN